MISVIVPIHNVEKYLEACVDSILNSTYTDFELILVDDGSTDRSGIICDDYQEKDRRVRVFHQANAGVSAARNSGLKASIGDFITFVDSDDDIHPQMLEILVNAILSGDYDMSMVTHADINFEDRDKYISSSIDELGKNEPKVMSQLEFTTTMFTYYQGQFLGPCHKLFKRSLIFTPENGFLEFLPIPAEDEEWMTRLCFNIKNVIHIPINLYFYVQRDDSLTRHRNENGINHILVGDLKTHYLCLNEIPKEYRQWRAACLLDLYHKTGFYNRLARGTSYADDVGDLYRSLFKNTIKEFLLSPVSPVAKVKHVIFYYCPWLYRFVVWMGETIAKLRRH